MYNLFKVNNEDTREMSVFLNNFMSGFELAIHNLQFAKRFGSLQMSFCIFVFFL